MCARQDPSLRFCEEELISEQRLSLSAVRMTSVIPTAVWNSHIKLRKAILKLEGLSRKAGKQNRQCLPVPGVAV